MYQTARFALAQLAPGQMQKEFFHNEALQQVDLLLCPVVEGSPQTAPPANPDIGACYLVDADATGAWLNKDGALACFTEGGWRFATPIEGMSVNVGSSGETALWRNGSWELGIVKAQQIQIDGQTVLRNRQPAISDPAGGTAVDVECRSTLGAVLATLRAHGLID